MKKILGCVVVALALAAALVPQAPAQILNAITPALLQARAWTFTALQTFTGGARLHTIYDDNASAGPRMVQTGTAAQSVLQTDAFPLSTFGIDYTMANPTVAPTLGSESVAGSCNSPTTYLFQCRGENTSGVTALSPTVSYVPTGASKRKTINQPAMPSNATAWRCTWSSDGGVTKNLCAATATAIGTTTLSCTCSAAFGTTTGINTSGPLGLIGISDGAIRGSRIVAGTPATFTDSPNRLYLNGAANGAPDYSSDSGSTRTALAVQSARRFEVCAVGCKYQTIAAAITAVSAAGTSNTNRAEVFVHPGEYNEGAFLPSYTTLRCADRNSTRVLGSGGPNVDAQETAWIDCNLGASAIGAPWSSQNSHTVSTTSYLIGNILGNYLNVDVYFVGKKSTLYADGNVGFSSDDGVRFDEESTIYDRNGIYFGVATGEGKFLYNNTGTSGRGFFWNTYINWTVTGTSGLMAALHFEDFSDPTETSGTSFTFVNPTIRVSATNASHTGIVSCVYLKAADANSFASLVDLQNMDCEATAANSTSSVPGIKIDNDADFANWTVKMRDGRIATSGGTTRYDVDNANTSAFSVVLEDVERNGTFNGSGNTYTTGSIPAGVCSAKVRVGDLCPNTSPALCFGTAADTWTKVSGGGSCP